MRYPAAVETLDYAPRPAARPRIERPVSVILAGLLAMLVFVAVATLLQLATVGYDKVWLTLIVGVLGGASAGVMGRRHKAAGRFGWWPMVGLPLLSPLPWMVVVPLLYTPFVPGRAFRSVFHESPPAETQLSYAARRNRVGGGHGFYFHADATTVARLIAAAGMKPDDEAAARAALPRPNAAERHVDLFGGGWLPAGVRPAPDQRPVRVLQTSRKVVRRPPYL